MFPGYVLSLREGLEAALLIGIMIGALKKMNRSQLRPYIWSGTFSAIFISILIALLLHRIGLQLEGDAEAIFEGITMLFAAAMLTWMIFWMHRKSHTLKNEIETSVGKAALVQNGKMALFLLAFLAVFREGVELALFLTASNFATSAVQTIVGAVLGLITAIILGWLTFTATAKMNLSLFFKVTNVILILFAGGMVAYAFHEFIEVGWIPAIVSPLWDINHILDENSPPGLILKSLFGYNGNPALSELLAYLAYFIAIIVGLRWAANKYPLTREVS